jgi:hypothetical protein
VGIGLGATAKSLRRTTAGSGMDTTIKYLVNQNAGAGNNWAKAHYTKGQGQLHKGWVRILLNPPVV